MQEGLWRRKVTCYRAADLPGMPLEEKKESPSSPSWVGLEFLLKITGTIGGTLNIWSCFWINKTVGWIWTQTSIPNSQYHLVSKVLWNCRPKWLWTQLSPFDAFITLHRPIVFQHPQHLPCPCLLNPAISLVSITSSWLCLPVELSVHFQMLAWQSYTLLFLNLVFDLGVHDVRQWPVQKKMKMAQGSMRTVGRLKLQVGLDLFQQHLSFL